MRAVRPLPPIPAAIPAPFRGELVKLAKLAILQRTSTTDILTQLAHMGVAWEPGAACICASTGDADARRWLHAHHREYAEAALAVLSPELREKVYHYAEGMDAPPNDGRMGAASIRRLQDWLRPHVSLHTPNHRGRKKQTT